MGFRVLGVQWFRGVGFRGLGVSRFRGAVDSVGFSGLGFLT